MSWCSSLCFLDFFINAETLKDGIASHSINGHEHLSNSKRDDEINLSKGSLGRLSRRHGPWRAQQWRQRAEHGRLDRGDARGADRADGRDAGAHGHAVDAQRACIAQALRTCIRGLVQFQVAAQGPKQRQVRVDVDLDRPGVHIQDEFHDRNRFVAVRPARYWAQFAVTLGVCAFLVVPIALSITAGVTENYFVGVRSGVTLRWVGEVWARYGDTIWRSIYVALACLACTLVLGIPTAYALARSRSLWTRGIEELLALPVAVPGFATALALIITYGGAFVNFRELGIHPGGPRALHAALHGPLGAGRDAVDRPGDPRGGRGEPRRLVRAALSRVVLPNCRPAYSPAR